MAYKFWEPIGQRLLAWSGWVFTVGGAIGSFVLGQGYAWIGWLAVLTGFLTVTAHAYTLYRRNRELEGQNTRLAEQLREADRKLNEVPLDLLNRIRELVTPQSLTDIAGRLAAHADYVLRIRQFVAADLGEIHLRKFLRRDAAFYAVAKVAGPALAHLREGDLFVLVRSVENLLTDSALMVVHQTPDPARDVVYFRIVKQFTDGTRLLEQLAASHEVAGLTGYTLRPACDPGWYSALDSATIPEAITRLAQGLERERRPGA